MIFIQGLWTHGQMYKFQAIVLYTNIYPLFLCIDKSKPKVIFLDEVQRLAYFVQNKLPYCIFLQIENKEIELMHMLFIRVCMAITRVCMAIIRVCNYGYHQGMYGCYQGMYGYHQGMYGYHQGMYGYH